MRLTLGRSQMRPYFVLSFLLLTLPVVCQQTSLPSSTYSSIVRATLVGGETLSNDERKELIKRSTGTTSHKDWQKKLTEELTKYLADEGFMKAEVLVRAKPFPADAENSFAVEITLKEDKRYTLLQVWWTGDSILTTSQLSGLLPVKSGDIIGRKAISQSETSIRRACSDKGFPDAIAILQLRTFDNGRAMLYVDVRDCSPSGTQTQSIPPATTSDLVCPASKDHPKATFPLDQYDPLRNAANDLADAKAEAWQTHKHILLTVGGNWCGWCKVLEKTFDSSLAAKRNKLFVSLVVNHSDENPNTCVLQNLPKADTYPYVYVLDASGKVLHTDDTTGWQFAGSYDPNRINEFLEKYAVD